MQTHISKLAQALVGVGLVAGASSLPAVAAVKYGDVHHRIVHRTHHRVDSSNTTVRKSAPREPVAAAHDAFQGPAAIITSPDGRRRKRRSKPRPDCRAATKCASARNSPCFIVAPRQSCPRCSRNLSS